ncbi:UNVERIFIED_CONTAM: hypothetical protein FKN15_026676 [Acipenser sinensis]
MVGVPRCLSRVGLYGSLRDASLLVASEACASPHPRAQPEPRGFSLRPSPALCKGSSSVGDLFLS